MTAPSIRILLCDDHRASRRSLHALLDADLTLDVVGEASSADEAVLQAAALMPDIVLMDIRMPGRSGIDACRAIRTARDQTRVLMLTAFADDEVLFTSVTSGGSGYVLKNARGNFIVEGIHRVAQGQLFLDPAASNRLRARVCDHVGLRPSEEIG